MNATPGTGFYDRIGRRLMDIGLSAMALVLLAPLLLAIAAAIAVVLGRPVFHYDRRAGHHGRPFWLRKFRTMSCHRDGGGALLPDEQRMTTLGRVLRQWSLDELPEFAHVLAGTMSLVGPRPLPLPYVERYTVEQARRLSVKPGLTGHAQVHGRNASSWDERLAQDVWYVDHRSLRLDLHLLMATVRVVAMHQDIAHPGHVTMHEFKGSTR